MRSFAIDAAPPCARRFGAGDAVVVVDVIRSMTTAVTAVALGARCLPVATLAQAFALARGLRRPLLVGEQRGLRPDGFDLTNSPSELAAVPDLAERAVVLLSTAGTPLCDEVRRAGALYAGCLRNLTALTDELVRHSRVTLLGAATRGEFREEDQLCCAYLGRRLLRRGFAAADEASRDLVLRWADAPPEAMLPSKSVAYLERSGARADLDFILAHIDDLDEVFYLRAGELLSASALRRARITI